MNPNSDHTVFVPEPQLNTICERLGLSRTMSHRVMTAILAHVAKQYPQYHPCIAWDIEEFRLACMDVLYNVEHYLIHTCPSPSTNLQPERLILEALKQKQVEGMKDRADPVNPVQTKVLDSLIECADCRRRGQYCRNVYVEQKQTRSGDEGMTAFAQCRNCKKRWKFAG